VREQAGEYHTEIITALSKFDTTRPLNQIRIKSLTTVAMEEEEKHTVKLLLHDTN
jgi:hypothetical protein